MHRHPQRLLIGVSYQYDGAAVATMPAIRPALVPANVLVGHAAVAPRPAGNADPSAVNELVGRLAPFLAMARLPLQPGILVLVAPAVLAAGIVPAGMDSYGDFATASSTASSAAVRKPPATPVAAVAAAAREGTR